MQFHRHESPQGNVVGAVDDTGVVIDGARYERSLILTPRRLSPGWRARAGEVSESDLLEVAEMGAGGEVVLLGSGARGVLAKPEWLALFAARGMSLESMSLRAACRTYAVLVADGRPAILALVF